jgi:cytochrome c biogenesis protein CcmG/thiol:disulfide interchange protein DsbE
MNRTTRRLGRPIATLLVASALLLGLGAPAGAKGLDSNERSPHVRIVGTKLVASDKIGTPQDPAIGKTAPTLKGLSLTGKKVAIRNDGKPHVVLFLSHSCPHCQAEVPVIAKLAQQGKLDGVEFDTVATNTSKLLPNWPPSKWLKASKWPFHPVLADDARLRAFLGYGGQAFPYFVLVGADGKVVARAAGELPRSTITEAAARLASGKPIFTSTS